MRYTDKTITLTGADRRKVHVKVEQSLRVTPKVRAELIVKHCPDAVEIDVYQDWNNSDEFMRASFRSGCNFTSYKLTDRGWVNTRKSSWTN